MRLSWQKSFICLLAILVLALFGSAVLISCDDNDDSEDVSAKETPSFVDVTARQAFDLINQNSDNPDFIILDVRTLSEFEEAHIQNAMQIDFYSETFRDDLDRLDKAKTYLLYCRSGNRSRQALEIMKDLGFMRVYHMQNGFIDWQEEGLPTVGASDMAGAMIYV